MKGSPVRVRASASGVCRAFLIRHRRAPWREVPDGYSLRFRARVRGSDERGATSGGFPSSGTEPMSALPAEAMFLRPAEAAALAGLSTRAIYRAIGRGELRAVRLCSRLRIPRDAFEAWIASSTVRVERRVVAVAPPAPPPARGSFRRLF